MAMQESAQMYLETIWVLKERSDTVRAVDIANEMNFSKPSVSVALKSLRNNGYIHVDKNGSILLTRLGEEAAKAVYDRHIVIEQALLLLGVPAETARQDACKIEHHISEITYQKLKTFLNKQ